MLLSMCNCVKIIKHHRFEHHFHHGPSDSFGQVKQLVEACLQGAGAEISTAEPVQLCHFDDICRTAAAQYGELGPYCCQILTVKSVVYRTRAQ